MRNVVDFPLIGPSWLLKQAIDAYNCRGDDMVAGWLARFRRSFDDIPFEERAFGDEYYNAPEDDDPYELLARVQKARGRAQTVRANGLLGQINRLFHCQPFISDVDVQEAMEEAGFGRMIFIDTGLDMPGGCEAAE